MRTRAREDGPPCRASSKAHAAQTNAAVSHASEYSVVPYGQSIVDSTEDQRELTRGLLRPSKSDGGAKEAGHGKGCGKGHGERGNAADEKFPRDALGEWRTRHTRHRRYRPANQMKWQDEKRDAGTVGRVGPTVEANLPVEDRLTALADAERLWNGEIAGIDQVFCLEVHLELVRNPEGVARRGQCVQREKEQKEVNSRPAPAQSVATTTSKISWVPSCPFAASML